MSPTVAEAVDQRRRSSRLHDVTRRLHGWGRPFLVACAATVVLRTVATCIALVTVYGVSFPHVVARTPHALVGVFNRWDTGYYSLIAAHGYPAAQRSGLPPAIAFGPLYPALVRSAQAVTGIGFLLAGQLVSMLALVVALAGLVHIAELDGDRVRSGTAVTLLVAFPTAFFLVIDYADSLALALVVWAFVAVRHRHWAIAGLCAAGAFLTKYYLAIVVVGLLAEVWGARRTPDRDRDRRRRYPWSLAWVALPTVVAIAGWMVYCAQRYGDALAFVHAQSHWNRHFGSPWTLAWTTGGDLVHLRFLDTGTASVTELFDTVTVVLLVVLAVYSFVRVRRSYGILLGLAVCIFTFQNILYSETREVLALFPFFIGGAEWVARHPWRERVVLALFIPSAYFLCTRFVSGMFAG